MNRQEKIIVLVLGAALAWCLYSNFTAKRSEAKDRAAQTARTAAAAKGAAETAKAKAPRAASAAAKPEAPKAAPPEKLHDVFVSVTNGQEIATFAANEKGVALKSVALLDYAHRPGPVSPENPAVVLDFGDAFRALALEGDAERGGVLEADSPTSVVFRSSLATRRFTLAGGYRIDVEEEFAEGAAAMGGALSLGTMKMGDSKNDLLSIDSYLHDNGKGKGEVVHHDEDDSMKAILAGGVAGGCGCGGAQGPAGAPARVRARAAGSRDWIALKNRFFVVAFSGCDMPNNGFAAEVARDATKAAWQPGEASVLVDFGRELPRKRRYSFYAGPKKQSLLWDAGMKDVMEFGMWRWLCYPMVWILAFFHSLIPNYGVAIILLTILVRLVFWPLTRKSTEGMRKMQEIQPLMKEIQAKYKDNPQRLQQETWALYKEKKVNPLSSCLPMLVQIPVFIALFNVLRSAVELRYAGFLWIADLSEPEALGAGSWFPFFGGLNILPLLMAGTMYFQSRLTPSGGDKSQQRMMTVFMPIMMLVMFYNFASALSLYWTVSQALSILQMWHIKRTAAKAAVEPEVIPPPQPTRQMRRHG